MDVASLADLLHETAEHHDPYEKTHAAAQLVGLVRRVHERARARELRRTRQPRPLVATWRRVLHVGTL